MDIAALDLCRNDSPLACGSKK